MQSLNVVSVRGLSPEIFFFLISKKIILLIKARETQKVHGSEQRKKETTRQKQPLIYSNRRWCGNQTMKL